MARRRIVTTVQSSGRWSVRDRVLGYRICNHYQHDKDPSMPSHIHYPESVWLAGCPIQTVQEAERIMSIYARRHTWFDLHALQEVIARAG